MSSLRCDRRMRRCAIVSFNRTLVPRCRRSHHWRRASLTTDAKEPAKWTVSRSEKSSPLSGQPPLQPSSTTWGEMVRGGRMERPCLIHKVSSFGGTVQRFSRRGKGEVCLRRQGRTTWMIIMIMTTIMMTNASLNDDSRDGDTDKKDTDSRVASLLSPPANTFRKLGAKLTLLLFIVWPYDMIDNRGCLPYRL